MLCLVLNYSYWNYVEFLKLNQFLFRYGSILDWLGEFYLILDVELLVEKLDQFLACFRHLVNDRKVKLNFEKLRFDLSV